MKVRKAIEAIIGKNPLDFKSDEELEYVYKHDIHTLKADLNIDWPTMNLISEKVKEQDVLDLVVKPKKTSMKLKSGDLHGEDSTSEGS